MDRILAAVLPTATNVSEEIAACETKEEFKRMVPGTGGGDVNSGVWHPGIHPVGQRILLCGRAKRHAEGNMDAYYL